MSNYRELETKVTHWAWNKGILEKGNPLAQIEKTYEEVDELQEALEAQRKRKKTFVNLKGKEVDTEAEIKDALGDILVTVIIGAELQGLKLEDCLASAYEVISKRTGKMVNGQFVKDAD